MRPGFATAEGTAAYALRFGGTDFYRRVQGLHLSNLGLGTYLGEPDAETDQRYTEAAVAAMASGINVLDAAINYRNQRSERSMGAALEGVAREEVVVCTKAGFLTPGAIPDSLREEDVVGGMHAMAPGFLTDQIERSCQNLGIATLDVFYLHNPETQLSFVSREVFLERVRRAFDALEQLAERGTIRFYGTATWDGYRKPAHAREALNLEELAAIARQAGGAQHHFRFVQLPLNLAMAEAFTQRDGGGRSVLDIARALDIAVVASATLMQAKLSRGLPEAFTQHFPGFATDAQRAIQFTRSTPGVDIALVGMSSVAHVAENLAVAGTPRLLPEAYRSLYRSN